MINRVILTGNLTADMETKTTQTGLMIAGFTLAVNRYIDKDKTFTSFFNCTAFGKSAEFLKNYASKGQKLLVEGYLQQDRWEDKEGKKQTKIKIMVERVEIFAKREGSEKPHQTPKGKNAPDWVGDEYEGLVPGDLPF